MKQMPLNLSNLLRLAINMLAQNRNDEAIKYAYKARDFVLYNMMEPVSSPYLDRANAIINCVYTLRRLDTYRG